MNPKEPIALVGVGCRFPGGADTPGKLWKLLIDGTDAVAEVPLDRWHLPSFYHPDVTTPGRTNSRWGGFLQHVEEFDAQFFGISPREAAKADPQQRLLLEVAYEALEDAGIPPSRIAGTNTGVFIGISTYDYGGMQANVRERTGIDAYTNLGSALCITANRVSYFFNLHGPSMAVDTACSSSLVATHLACQSIWKGECETSFIGGVNLMLRPEGGIGFSKASMLAPDGHCKPFDSRANGYVRGEGIGVVIVKPLSKALSDGDHIYAVIRSTAVNQDGRTSGISVPSAQAQETMLREALREADIPSESIQYVEAHGTGTPVGDPIEATALGRVFGERRPPGNNCLIGSIKSNIGHPEAASGIAGLIKGALCLKHGQLPPSLHFVTPNPAIPFDDLRLRVVTALENWPDTGNYPRRIGVNSFGFGGTNAHAILEGAPESAVSQSAPSPAVEDKACLLPLSAHSEASLQEIATRFRHFFAAEEPSDKSGIREISYTASLRRAHHDVRLAVVGRSRQEFVEHLDAFLANEHRLTLSSGRKVSAEKVRPVFVCSGMGQQWWAMGRQLMQQEQIYRETIEAVDALFQGFSGWSFLPELQADEASSKINESHIAQPAIFSMQVALAALWRSWGVEPAAVAGHSIGEVSASFIAGALSLEDATQIIFHRSRLQRRTAGQGRMLAVGLAYADAAGLLDGIESQVSVAAINGPQSITLTGEAHALEEISERLTAQNVFCRFLQVDVPYHSPMMDSLRTEFIDSLRNLRPQAARQPLFSTVTGKEVAGTELNADYWWQNIRNPVRFQSAMAELAQRGHEIFLEIGAHPVLSAAIQECLKEAKKDAVVLPSLHRKEEERAMMLGSLGRLYVLGANIDWEKLHPQGGRIIDLPLYAWQREKYWSESETSVRDRLRQGVSPLLAWKLESAQPVWETELDLATLPYIKDHRVREAIVCPAALYVAMALAAARETLGPVPCVLEEIEFSKALFFAPNEITKLQITSDGARVGFEISSCKGNSSWISHARGKQRQLPQNSSTSAADLARIRERCSTPISKEECYRSFQKIGLDYGPMFQGIESLWTGNAEALGAVQLSRDLTFEVDAYRVHPALLDSCFQVLLGALREVSRTQDLARSTYLPVQIERIIFHSAPGERVLAYARLIEYNSRQLKGDIQVFNETGNCLLEIRGFMCRSIARTSETVRGCLYEYQWKLQARQPDSHRMRVADHIASPASLAPALSQEVDRLRRELRRDRYYNDFLPPARDLAAAYVVRALSVLGWDPARDAQLSAGELAAHLRVLPEYQRLLARLLRGLSQEDISAARDPRPLWNDLWQRFPDAQAELTLLRDCAEALAKVFRGEVDPLDLLFPEGSATTLEYLYQDSPSFRIYNRLVQKVIREVVDQLPDDRMLRILEVGAGTGGLTAFLLSVLPPHRTQYVFTDVAPLLVNQAEQKFREYSFVQYKTLDIEADPAEQGFEEHSFDLVLASDALHATRDLKSTVDRVRRLLGSNGLLVLLEGARAPLGIILMFGLLRGWWLFSDEELRGLDPWIAPQLWRRILEEAGFAETLTLSDREDAENAVHSVILSRAPSLAAGTVPIQTSPAQPGNWMVFCDGSAGETASAGMQVAEQLRNGGDHVILVRPGNEYRQLDSGVYQLRPESAEDVQRLVNSLVQNLTPWRGVIHLWSLDASGKEPVSIETFRNSWTLNCANVLHLIHSLGACKGEAVPSLWLVTRNAEYVSGCGQEVDVTQSALWGLARVAVNEYPQLKCRTVDLHSASAKEIRILVDELLQPEEEDEIAIRGEARYVHRLVQTSLNGLAQVPPAALPHSFHIAPHTPGLLDSLVAMPVERRAPGAGDVEIEVQAAGLNFKDVMLSMALLPDESGVPEFAGIPLGLECAGTITAVGPGVTDFRKGDGVIACGAGTLATHLTIGSRFVMHKPANLTFEEASTIPVAFLTAYYALHHLGRMQKGDRVLIHAATGGVGLAALQMAQHAGAQIFATAGTPGKRQLLHSLGVKHVMDSRGLSFAEEILELTAGEGVDLVLNSLAGEAIPKSLSILRPGGRFLEIGKRDIYENKAIGLRPFLKNLSFFAIDLSQSWVQNANVVRPLFDEVVELLRQDIFRPLPYRAVPAGRVAGALRHMAQAKHIGKVVLCMKETDGLATSGRTGPVQFRSDATYLITGGLGGFGLAVAEWLVRNGARNLVLIGRQAPSASAKSAIEELRAHMTRVVVRQADVTDLEQMHEVLQFIHDSMPPLRGVVHAAMVLDDAPILNLTAERMWNVFAPKALGAWNLHRLTADVPLDFFILFSSFTSLIGNTGQANYVSGNSFLDALAHHRQLHGLPALTVNWGALAKVGYVARNSEIKDRVENLGVKSMSAEELLAVLGELLSAKAVQVGVARIEWDRVVRLFGSHVAPRFTGLVAMADAEKGGSAIDMALSAILDAEPTQRQPLLETFIREHLARVMGTSPSRLDLKQPLMSLGLDSLMAVEMRNRIQSSLGVDVPPTKFLEGISISGLASFVEEKLALTANGKAQAVPVSAGQPGAPVESSPPAEETQLLDEIDKLSNEEVDLRLREIVARAGGG